MTDHIVQALEAPPCSMFPMQNPVSNRRQQVRIVAQDDEAIKKRSGIAAIATIDQPAEDEVAQPDYTNGKHSTRSWANMSEEPGLEEESEEWLAFFENTDIFADDSKDTDKDAEKNGLQIIKKNQEQAKAQDKWKRFNSHTKFEESTRMFPSRL